MGRHKSIETPEEFEALVDEYRALCEAEEKPVTFTGMARHLGFASRQSFYDYGKDPKFAWIASRARMLVEEEYEMRLHGNTPTGAIFALKNSGWSDRQQIETSTFAYDPEKFTDEGNRRVANGESPRDVAASGGLKE